MLEQSSLVRRVSRGTRDGVVSPKIGNSLGGPTYPFRRYPASAVLWLSGRAPHEPGPWNRRQPGRTGRLIPAVPRAGDAPRPRPS
jgi:hypothetical protein